MARAVAHAAARAVRSDPPHIPSPMRRLASAPALRFGIALAALLTAAGCDSAPPSAGCITGTEPACPPPAQDEVVAGVNLTALFAAPTDAEHDSVAARVDRTPASTSDPVQSVVATDLPSDADATRYVRLDLRAGGGATLAYALARVPAVDGGAGGPLRTLLLLPDSPGNASEADFLTGRSAQGLDRDAVQVVVALRGATLSARGPVAGGLPAAYASAAPAEPYRSDVADLLALAARIGVVPRVDASRLVAVGTGRGGTAVLLAAEREPGRFGAVGTFGAPTSLFDPSFRAATRDALRGAGGSRLPDAAALLAPVLDLRDGRIPLAEARLRLLELSAVTLADRLPATVALHADPDDIVPTSHLDRLLELGDGTLDAPRRFQTFDNATHASLPRLNDARNTLAFFLNSRP